jgi:hypothetical protein
VLSLSPTYFENLIPLFVLLLIPTSLSVLPVVFFLLLFAFLLLLVFSFCCCCFLLLAAAADVGSGSGSGVVVVILVVVVVLVLVVLVPLLLFLLLITSVNSYILFVVFFARSQCFATHMSTILFLVRRSSHFLSTREIRMIASDIISTSN